METAADYARRYALAVLVHLAVVVAWHLLVVLGGVPGYVMPSPRDTLAALGEDDNWVRNTLVTASEISGEYTRRIYRPLDLG